MFTTTTFLMNSSSGSGITPSVLAWARKGSGLSEGEVVEKIQRKRVTTQVLREWEEGVSEPTYSQLKQLAEVYNRPVALFFFPEPPEEASMESDFRSLPLDTIEKMSARIRYLVRSAKARVLELYELYGGVEMTAGVINMGRKENESAIQMANRIRHHVGISLQDQVSWEDSDYALKQWRHALEGLGVWVFKDAFKSDDYCGFCVYDTRFPIIYINNSHSKQRQIFTLFHELGHLLLGKAGVDFRQVPKLSGQYQKDEVFCNAFAGAFLLPSSALRSYTSLPDDKGIEDVARKYKVSFDVVLRKFLDRKLISQTEYEKKIGARNKRESKKLSGGDYYATQKTYLGSKYIDLVFTQYYQGRIDQGQAADYLGMNVRSMQNLESKIDV